MKVFSNLKEAHASYSNKKVYFLNSECPFTQQFKLCGTWCALCYLEKLKGKPRFVILGCKGTDKKLYID